MSFFGPSLEKARPVLEVTARAQAVDYIANALFTPLKDAFNKSLNNVDQMQKLLTRLEEGQQQNYPDVIASIRTCLANEVDERKHINFAYNFLVDTWTKVLAAKAAVKETSGVPANSMTKWEDEGKPFFTELQASQDGAALEEWGIQTTKENASIIGGGKRTQRKQRARRPRNAAAKQGTANQAYTKKRVAKAAPKAAKQKNNSKSKQKPKKA